jgi:hypothetical protein
MQARTQRRPGGRARELWLAAALAACACAGAGDAGREQASAPRFEPYAGKDAAAVYVVAVDRLSLESIGEQETRCDLRVRVDGAAVEPSREPLAVAPGVHHFELEGWTQVEDPDHPRAPARTQRLASPGVHDAVLGRGDVYALVALCSVERTVDSTLLRLGQDGTLRRWRSNARLPWKLQTEDPGARASVTSALDAIAVRHNLRAHVWVIVDAQPGRLRLPVGLTASGDAQARVDAARAAADCARGNEVPLDAGRTSGGQLVSLALRCHGEPPVWEARVRIGAAELDPALLDDLLMQEPRALPQLEAWLSAQAFDPPVDPAHVSAFAVEIVNVLRGDRTLERDAQ